MKILFTSVGRRVELIQEFKKAATELGFDLCVYGVDNSETAPALYFCDKTKMICKIKDINYIPTLLTYCKEEGIDGLIPTIDTDLEILAQNKAEFEKIGTKLFVGSVDKIKICRDKIKTAEFFKSLGLNTPELVDDYQRYKGGYPAFIRPKDGSSSINAYKVNDAEELKAYASEIPNYIIAPFVEGVEYTVDAFCDYLGNPIFITPRIRLLVRAGEVIKTQITLDDKIIEESKRIIEEFKPSGAITIQLIRDKETKEDYFIEINPRFGGGSPLSMKAGAKSALALIKVLNNERVEYQHKAAIDGAIYSRYEQSVRVK